jgi:hypothetical protein
MFSLWTTDQEQGNLTRQETFRHNHFIYINVSKDQVGV